MRPSRTSSLWTTDRRLRASHHLQGRCSSPRRACSIPPKVFLSLEGSGNERIVIRQVDGVALLAAEIETEPIESLIHRRVPLVTMDRRVVGPGLSDVMIDHVSGMREAIYHLRDLGHQRIAYIGGSSGLTISDHRISAFHEAMSGAD